MQLSTIDWLIIVAFFAISTGIGLWASRTAGKSFKDYFLAGGKMSWWLLGVSMVATTFAADTPGLVTELVRKGGVSGNWAWWAFLLTGLLTVFVYSKLWKRSGVLTDLEFYELRYGGAAGQFLRGFRAIYLGVVFNCMVMAVVILAAIKLSGVLLGASPMTTVLVAGSVTVVYTLLGGLKGVILTDFFQFGIAMVGAIAAAVVLCDQPEVGGFANLIANENVASKLSLLPDFSQTSIIPLLIIPLAIQWWSAWYPGAEPGGGGYVAQRMLSAKSESDATAATLLFQVAHYALRPWPWIVVALASIVVFPEISSIEAAFPNIDKSLLSEDIAYPAMLSRLPAGLLGLVIASLIAAFMSTISTHLNWGGSYIAHDFYGRFITPDASEKQLVMVGRVSTVALMAIASVLALYIKSAADGFNMIVQFGAGTGLIYILRWFWWRVNAWSEIVGMVASTIVAIVFTMSASSIDLEPWHKILIGVLITNAAWIAATFLTRPSNQKTLEDFYQKVRPDGPGWEPVRSSLSEKGTEVELDGSLTSGIAAMVAATFLVYSLLFGVGYFLYGQTVNAGVSAVVTVVAVVALVRIWPRLKMN
ncbi:sodium:solute symporter family protein [Mariniblastus fucicola]|uniref:Sodium/glucose cotransporter n=1 Tax=Mariniblastus fucicola TaxID=980251 RepID=A0A5B9PGB3_9BACT|nr:sodium:solute symporter family protein [Mariniblastus fucicola]QEG23802.1 Sodium/glucose cotransporter [Mariniblastus fucicola]